MKAKRIKGLIKQLLIQYNGSLEAVATELNISVRYAEMLRDGKKKAGFHLAEFAKRLLNE